MEGRISKQAVAPRKGKKRYACHFEGCNKDFGKNYNLKAHIRMHTGEKPFKCNYADCGKTFMWRSSWISHLAAHKGLASQQQISGGDAPASRTQTTNGGAASVSSEPANPASYSNILAYLNSPSVRTAYQQGQGAMNMRNDGMQAQRMPQNQQYSFDQIIGNTQQQTAPAVQGRPQAYPPAGKPQPWMGKDEATKQQQASQAQDLARFLSGERKQTAGPGYAAGGAVHRGDQGCSNDQHNESAYRFMESMGSVEEPTQRMGMPVESDWSTNGTRPAVDQNDVKRELLAKQVNFADLTRDASATLPTVSQLDQMDEKEQQALMSGADLNEHIRSLELDLGDFYVDDEDSKHADRADVGSAKRKEIRFAEAAVKRSNPSKAKVSDRFTAMSPMVVTGVPSPFHPGYGTGTTPGMPGGGGGLTGSALGAFSGWNMQTPTGLPPISPGRGLGVFSPSPFMSPGGLLASPTLMSPGVGRASNVVGTTFPAPLADGSGE
ncbi:hypothetical protein NDN08_003591 [Rhodosorus marinus]|uniref:C2H2-type domain-containing protein n=1 Tax=Rhodosorus marinus TaxID=101924 RepID=A0AAV8UX84_9RHOD|nr:hypothetical protein NDN08_003591 [Rhodosorus marinus]